METLRNIDKMNYYQDGSRSLNESIINKNVIEALPELRNTNDAVVIGGVAVSFHTKPVLTDDIDILVRDKNNVLFMHHAIDVKEYTDIGITEEHFDFILKNSSLHSGLLIPSPTALMTLSLKDDIRAENRLKRNSCTMLSENCKINMKDVMLQCSADEYNFLIYRTKLNNNDYTMKHLKPQGYYTTARVFEGFSGYPEVDRAFSDWVRNTDKKKDVLIGGMAILNHISNLRSTTDADFIFMSEDDIPSFVSGFKKARGHAFKHLTTHVEIEVLTPEFLHINKELADAVFNTAYDKGEYMIASPSALIALKLDRLNDRDIVDITALSDNYQIDLSPFIPFLSEKAVKNIDILKADGINI